MTRTHPFRRRTVPALLAGLLALPPAARASAEPAAAKVVLADARLVDQDGAALDLRRDVVKDEIVVVDFVFTTCTTVCPALSAILARVQEQLGDRLGRGVRLVSVSLDPAHDTPARLKTFAARYGAGPRWTWLTGEKEDVERVLKGLGAYTPDFSAHAPMVLVGDGRTGEFVRINGFAAPERIVGEVDRLLGARAEGGRIGKQRDWFTNTALVTARGEEVRFFEDVVKDHVVVIQFIFTRCSGACPLLTQKLLQARAAMGGTLGERVRFVSISVDPDHDGPAELRAFAERQGSAVPGWLLLGGRKANVDLVVKRLGAYVEAPEDHATVFIAGNARTAHWLRIRPDAPAEVIARQIEALRAEDATPARG